jgi:siroheme synthase (precorrin-2 oxidase/ferrochelatase)
VYQSMARTRITIDSVLDRDNVRVLISTDGKTETPVVMEKEALKELLKDRKELWTKNREGKDRLIRDIEGEVVSFEQTDTPFFIEISTIVRPREVRKIRRRDIRRGLRTPKRETEGRRKKIRKIEEKLRKRMGGA